MVLDRLPVQKIYCYFSYFLYQIIVIIPTALSLAQKFYWLCPNQEKYKMYLYVLYKYEL